ncbi:MAG: 50S ribosomal protein L40e [archaeon]
MAIFPEMKARKLLKKICRKCKSKNAWNAEKCRKCGSSQLRPKKGEKKVK